MHVHSFKPFNNGTLNLYCQFCGKIVIAGREIKPDQDYSTEELRTRPQAPNGETDGEEETDLQGNAKSYQDMEAELLRLTQDMYPHHPNTNIPVRQEFETEGDISDFDDDYPEVEREF